MASKGLNIAAILVLLVGAFMVLDGIDTLTGNTQGIGGLSHDVSRAFGGSGNTANILIAVVEIVAGALLLLSRFASIGSLDKALRFVILIFWIFLMILGLFLGGNIKNIDTLGWWSSLVNHCIILVVLWMIKN